MFIFILFVLFFVLFLFLWLTYDAWATLWVQSVADRSARSFIAVCHIRSPTMLCHRALCVKYQQKNVRFQHRLFVTCDICRSVASKFRNTNIKMCMPNYFIPAWIGASSHRWLQFTVGSSQHHKLSQQCSSREANNSKISMRIEIEALRPATDLIWSSVQMSIFETQCLLSICWCALWRISFPKRKTKLHWK